MSLLLINASESSEGLSTTPIKTVFASSARTAFVTFENVKVPIGNLIGKEGQGMALTFQAFGHERRMIAVKMLARARLVVEESLKWALQRRAFDKPLINSPRCRRSWPRWSRASRRSSAGRSRSPTR
jgi:alkylation response protein AidB-like acyl-CoA dehydrogenase